MDTSAQTSWVDHWNQVAFFHLQSTSKVVGDSGDGRLAGLLTMVITLEKLWCCGQQLETWKAPYSSIEPVLHVNGTQIADMNMSSISHSITL